MKPSIGFALPLLVFALGCGSDAVGAAEEDGGAEDGGAGDSGLEWETCPLVTGDQDSGAAQCVTVPVPLDWEEPDGTTIELFLKRRLRAGSVGQLWLLAGGPGQAGSSYEDAFTRLERHSPVLDTYLLDHRGTGRSAFLGCPSAETPESPAGTRVNPAEIAQCLSELEPDTLSSLPHFNVTNAARDLGHLIERAHEAGRSTVVMGVSYGTMWAQRYLALYPDQPSAVVLDSIAVDGELSYFSTVAGDFDEIGKWLLDQCAQVPDCAAHLGADPRQAMAEAIRRTDAGHCGGHITALRRKAGFLLQDYEKRNLVPALIHRVLRCDERDQLALSALERWFAEPQAEELGYSDLVWFNIALSEYMPIPAPTFAEAADYEQSLWFVHLNPTYFAAASAAWPTYARDEHWGKLADSTVPMLMLQGGADPVAAPRLGTPLRDHFRGPHQTYVEVPYSTHVVFDHSKLAADPETTCGALLLQQFLADPKASLDTRCTGEVQPPTFTADDATLLAMFGTTDLWGDTPKAAPVPALP